MAQRPKGQKGGTPSNSKRTLHAPLEMKNRTHKEQKLNPKDAHEGIRRAEAELKRRQQKSAFARYAPLFAMPFFVLLMVGTYAYLWYSAAQVLRDLSAAAQISEDGDGWTIRSSDPDIGGFPIKVGAILSDVEVIAPERWGGWVWKAEKVQLSVDPWAQHAPRIDVIDHSQLRTADGTLYDLSAESARLTLSLKGDNQIDSLGITLTNGTAQPHGGAPPLQIGSFTLQADPLPRPETPNLDGPIPTYGAALSLRETVVPPEMAPTIGPMLNELTIQARLLGPLGEGSLREMMTKWRDDGGVAEIDHLYIDWSPLKMAATGTLALDDRMQPVGALSSQIQGFFETVEQLYQAKVMRARDATLARVVLGTMAQMKGGVPTLTTPLSIQSETLILGPVTVMQLPRIHWPGPGQMRELPSLRPSYEVDRWGRLVPQE